jgi:hypothetical protein
LALFTMLARTNRSSRKDLSMSWWSFDHPPIFENLRSSEFSNYLSWAVSLLLTSRTFPSKLSRKMKLMSSSN